MFHVPELDQHGHYFGPNHYQFNQILRTIDELTKYLHDQLCKNNLDDKANIVHLSSHGMVATTTKNILNVTKYLTPNSYFMVGSSPIRHVYAKYGKVIEICCVC